MVYKPRYSGLGLDVTMLALVVKFTRMENMSVTRINFSHRSTSLVIQGGARLAAHLR
jgi:hypothetical protein